MPQRSIRDIVAGQEPITAPGSATVAEAARLMKEKKIGAVMVVEEGKLIGVFTERDALFRVVAECRDAQTTRVSEVMTGNPRTIHPDKAFTDAMNIMHAGGFRQVPVVEDGRPIGMISVRDALGPELEAFIYELLRQEQAQDVFSG
jgi:CBS domain-containing protein